MPRKGYTGITVPIGLKDRLKEAASAQGHPSVPSMLDSWLKDRTGTVQVQGGPGSRAPTTRERVNLSGPSSESRQNTSYRVWCGRRDSNPGRLRGRQISYQAGLRPRIPTIRNWGILIYYPEIDAEPLNRKSG